MRDCVDGLLGACGGAASRAQLLRVLTVSELDDEVRSGALVRLFRRAYSRPWDADQIDVLERAAVVSVGAPVALSHLTALRRRGLLDTVDHVHVSIPDTRMSRGQPGLVVHRVVRPPRSLWLGGLPTVSTANALVTSWPLLPVRDRRTPAIAAVRQGVVTPAQLCEEVDRHARLRDRRGLRSLLSRLDAGCQSELEIWGFDTVFAVAGLRHGVRQRTVRVGSTVYRLDLAYDAERVAVELDGDRFHSSPASRDGNRRRDAALATAGWLTLRFSWTRLHEDVAGCRRDTLATLAFRRHHISSRVTIGVLPRS